MALLATAFKNFGDRSIGRVLSLYRSSGAKASGKTGESLRHTETEEEFNLYGSGVLKVIERGRKQGKVPKDFVKIILEWMRIRGIVPSGNTTGKTISKETLAFLIARKIRQEGTLLYRKKDFRDVYSSVINPDSIQDLFQTIGEQKLIDISSDIVKAFK